MKRIVLVALALVVACSTAFADGFTQKGTASFYSRRQRIAAGGWYNPNALTAAHRTLPLGTKVLVYRPSNGKSVEVVINDRGPYTGGRIIDLSRAAASAIDLGQKAGITKVQIRVVKPHMLDSEQVADN
jgi:rare lipoprotein A